MRAGHWLIFLVVIVTRVTGGPRYSSRIVETRTGPIRGIILELNSGRLEPVEAFLGVKYATAIRYGAAEPVPRWSSTKLADSQPPVCPQAMPDISNKTAALQFMPKNRYNFLRKLSPLLANQTEDCLHLNIYVPGSGARGMEAPYAVMVYLHGESYDWNSGNHYDGRVLASFGHVIFITVNYRLGLLGFLRAGSGIDSPLATDDIMAALRWVRDNIAFFGGDPRRVTLMGHDTGAALANLLLISPQAKGLFSRVALLSGSILSPWAVGQDPVGLREKVGTELGCKTGPKDDLAKCLRARPLAAILSVRVPSPRFLTGVGPWTRSEPSTAVETSGEPFLSSRVLLGTTTTESYLDFNNQDIQYGIEEDQRNRVLRTYVRNAYVYHLNEIFSTVRNEYTDWEKPIQHPINIRDSTLEALSDGHTVAPLLRLGYLHSRRGSPTYFYHFNYQTKESDYPQRLGSVRGEDVNYLLGLPLVGGYPYFPQNYTTQDHKVAESVLNFFTNFAKTGDPNEPRRAEGGVPHSKEKGRHRGFNWELYEPTTQLYLSLLPSRSTTLLTHSVKVSSLVIGTGLIKQRAPSFSAFYAPIYPSLKWFDELSRPLESMHV
ncbi:neuroligin-1-like [Cimex lectularius]|uniref:Carboxylesterase type B domain-containing protein n=1 Tax=Cimex lectularius TaxID=79782 RepID=A0A8I6SLC1_CIMLE|nr:neuroligin-1-like [Cimex lectularius]